MAEFLEAILEMPTAVFTALLGLVVVYWLLVIAGALDLDILDAEPDLDIPDAAPGAGSVAALGLRDVPVALWLSVFVLTGWVVSIGASRFASNVLGSAASSTITLAAIFALTIVVATAVTAIAVRPLFPLFAEQQAIENRVLVGKTCAVTTLRVDDRFGQALVEDGGAGLLVQVRCPQSNDLTKGSIALIYDYNPEEGIFHVAAYDDSNAHQTF